MNHSLVWSVKGHNTATCSRNKALPTRDHGDRLGALKQRVSALKLNASYRDALAGWIDHLDHCRFVVLAARLLVY